MKPPPDDAFGQWLWMNLPYIATGLVVLIGLGTLAAGLWMLRGARRARRVAAQMHTFPSVPGEVLVSEQRVTMTRYGTPLYAPQIEYRYTVADRTYTSQHVLPGPFAEARDPGWVAPWLEAYPVGRQIEVFIDPANPRVSVVDRQTEAVRRDTPLDMALGCLLVGVALWMLYVAFFILLPEGGKPLPQADDQASRQAFPGALEGAVT